MSCFVAGIIAAFIILRREISYESIFFSLFLIGTGFYVFLYLFLAIEPLRFIHYPLEMISMEIATYGFTMYAICLHKEGEDFKKIGSIIAVILAIPPMLCTILSPWTYIHTSYGVELNIEPWFLILAASTSLVVLSYSASIIVYLSYSSPNVEVKKRIKIIIGSLIIIMIFGAFFLAIVPGLTGDHTYKPIGYYVISAALISMTWAFRKGKDS